MSTFSSFSDAMPIGSGRPLVLVLGEAKLRDELATCLSATLGEQVIIARDFADRRLAASIGRNSVLVTDTMAAAQHPAGVSGVAIDPRWTRAIVLAEHGIPARAGDRLAFVERAAPPMAVAALAAEWLAEC